MVRHALKWVLMGLLAAISVSSAWAANEVVHVQLQTSAGNVRLELYPQYAPQTVANFVKYVQDKHYDGTIFHRVIKDFMIQGGGFDEKYVQKPTRAPVKHEGLKALTEGGLRNSIGSVAMARTSDPQSASAQFFINTKDNAFLDPVPLPAGDPIASFTYQGQTIRNVPRAQLEGHPQLAGYTVFGKVVAGMDVVNTIQNAPTTGAGPFATDVPQKPIFILKATLENTHDKPSR